jgi:hypothetical protein
VKTNFKIFSRGGPRSGSHLFQAITAAHASPAQPATTVAAMECVLA